MFTAIINTPGYIPVAKPVVFDVAKDAWAYLADERERHEDLLGEGPTGTVENLRARAADPFATAGFVFGDTPGYEGDHDLGIAYCVDIME